MKTPRFRRKWAVRIDLGYYRRPDGVEGPGPVFSSGPYRDKFFWTEKKARAYAVKHDSTMVFKLGWVNVEKEKAELRESFETSISLGRGTEEATWPGA